MQKASQHFWECLYKCSVGKSARSTVLAPTALISLLPPKKRLVAIGCRYSTARCSDLLQWSHQASSIGVVTLASSTGGSLAQDIKHIKQENFKRGMQIFFFFLRCLLNRKASKRIFHVIQCGCFHVKQ